MRRFRGVTYNITVHREGPGNTVKLIVDGQPIEGDVIPPPADGRTEVSVEVVLH